MKTHSHRTIRCEDIICVMYTCIPHRIQQQRQRQLYRQSNEKYTKWMNISANTQFLHRLNGHICWSAWAVFFFHVWTQKSLAMCKKSLFNRTKMQTKIMYCLQLIGNFASKMNSLAKIFAKRKSMAVIAASVAIIGTVNFRWSKCVAAEVPGRCANEINRIALYKRSEIETRRSSYGPRACVCVWMIFILSYCKWNLGFQFQYASQRLYCVFSIKYNPFVSMA